MLKSLMEQLLPWYAQANAVATLSAQGFEIETETLENGQVKIVAGKWV